MRRIRREMPPEIVQKKDQAIYERLISMEQYRRAKTIVVYVSKELEVDTRRLMEKAWEDGKKVAAPRCVENTRLMNMHLITSMDDLQEGAYGILEPKESLPILEDTKNALCIVPAFCNDYRGYRVGYGGGYYDRYLARCGAFSLALAYEAQRVPQAAAQEHDVLLGAVASENRLYWKL